MDMKKPVTRRIKQSVFARSKDCARLVKITDDGFTETALIRYCEFIEDNPPAVIEHTHQKLADLIAVVESLNVKVNALEKENELYKKINGASIVHPETIIKG